MSSDHELRVCLLINQIAPGGAPTELLDIVTRTDDPDMEYTLAFVEGDDSLADDFERAGARVVDFGAEFKFDPRALYRMVQFFRRNKFDLIHANLPYSQTLGRIVSLIGDVGNVVSTQHNVPSNYHPITRYLERSTRPIDSRTIAVSEGVERAFTGSSEIYHQGMDRQWCTIHNGISVPDFRGEVQGIDTTPFDSRPGSDAETVFLSVARYVPAKSLHDLIDAVGELDAPQDDVHLFLVGWGPLEEDLRSRAAQQGVDDQITITGRLPQDELYDAYKTADVFVSSSVREGFPVSILEAMAVGLPVIGTDIPGVSEAIESGETGLIVQSRSPSQLAEAMATMEDKSLQEQYGNNGYDRVNERFNIEKAVNSHVSLYKETSNYVQ